jgi:hypothetical protein
MVRQPLAPASEVVRGHAVQYWIRLVLFRTELDATKPHLSFFVTERGAKSLFTAENHTYPLPLYYKNPSFLAPWHFGPAICSAIPCSACVANEWVRNIMFQQSEEQI